MEKITTYNYEAFYLDYLEGNLDEDGRLMLFNFLDANPLLKLELESDGDILDFTLNTKSDSLTKFEKEDLKHFDCKENEICLKNVNEFLVVDLENEISPEKKIELNEFIVEHDLQVSQSYFQSTILKANLTEVYPDKGELKKKGTIIPLFAKIASVAAVGLLVFNLINSSSNSNELYTPRQGEFALQIDSSNQTFDINTNSVDLAPNNYATVNSNNEQNNTLVENEKVFQSIDSLITPSISNDPIDDVVEDPNDHKNDYPIMPLYEDAKDDIAIVGPTEKSEAEIKLVDMYKPVTNLTNNYTNLDVSYQKSVPESDYAVTAFSIGKFSFERKKKK